MEREQGEWLQENTFLYDRSLNEYHNKSRKDSDRTERAPLLTSLSDDDIGRWIKGMRTMYGKLCNVFGNKIKVLHNGNAAAEGVFSALCSQVVGTHYIYHRA